LPAQRQIGQGLAHHFKRLPRSRGGRFYFGGTDAVDDGRLLLLPRINADFKHGNVK
jgi:hypothetical protein